MPWTSPDPLTAVLSRLRMRGAFYSWTEAAGAVSVGMPVFAETLSFHIVARGSLHLEFEAMPAVQLNEGEMALVPRGIGHRLSSVPGAPFLGRADELPQTMLGDAFSIMRVGPQEEEASAAVLCGIVTFESPAVRDMLAVLPPLVRVDSRRHKMMASLLPLLANEIREPRPGGDAVATRLADVLIIETIRAWLADHPDGAAGWLTALRDPQLGGALAAIHKAPGEAWTLANLARRAGMSRTAFSARFAEVVGTPPMTYLAEMRMREARQRLGEGEAISAVALAMGYGSEAAFSRAFTRITGQTPGRVRRAA
jgi:AraC-like DNA-binding protein